MRRSSRSIDEKERVEDMSKSEHTNTSNISKMMIADLQVPDFWL